MTTYSRSFLYEKYKNDCVSREAPRYATLTISSNVIKKFSEVSAVNLTDAKKASVTNSNATNNNYFMKVACTH